MEKERLFSEFPPVETEAWKNRIIEDLKGADYDKKMVWKTNEGFEVKPFYRKEDVPQRCSGEVPGEFPFTRGNRKENSWFIRQEIQESDAVKANSMAKEMIG